MSIASFDAPQTAAARRARPAQRAVPRVAASAAFAWALAAATTFFAPDLGDWGETGLFAALAALVALALASAAFASGLPRVRARLDAAPWALALGLFVALWQLLTAKTGYLPAPFFPPPHALLAVFVEDGGKLLESVLASLRLLAAGLAFGAAAGFLAGVGLGASRAFGYWAHPVLRLIGPLPAIAWLPVAFYVFPSSWSASVFLIALAAGFPITVLTWSGVASVNPAFYDVARTLGASRRFLILKVAIPAALPHVFVGAFMGLGASFAVLVTAEMMGVKAGLGFYLQWAQGWAAYANMYAALLVMSAMCSTLVTLLFKLRDHALSYQKDAMKW